MYICGKKREVPGHPELILDEYAEGRFYVLQDGARIGHVIGGNRRYNAEIGETMHGTYPSPAKAAVAVSQAR